MHIFRNNYIYLDTFNCFVVKNLLKVYKTLFEGLNLCFFIEIYNLIVWEVLSVKKN